MKHRIRFIPVFIIVVGFALSLKIGDLATNIGDLVAVADAQEQPVAEQGQTGNQTGDDVAGTGGESGGNIDDSVNGVGPINDPLLMTRSELDLLQDLAARRQQLDGQARQQEMRERLLEATEARIDSKIIRLESIRTQIEALLVEHQTLKNEQLQSLVKLYESMKPKDAARILERLEIDIQMEVATRMKPAKMAPIMAAMAADSARSLTVEMATRARLPVIEG